MRVDIVYACTLIKSYDGRKEIKLKYVIVTYNNRWCNGDGDKEKKYYYKNYCINNIILTFLKWACTEVIQYFLHL